MSRTGFNNARAQQQRDGVPALYPGLCTRCDEHWRINDHIVKRGTRWYHAACGKKDDE